VDECKLLGLGDAAGVTRLTHFPRAEQLARDYDVVLSTFGR
jgi:hypothetical protein